MTLRTLLPILLWPAFAFQSLQIPETAQKNQFYRHRFSPDASQAKLKSSHMGYAPGKLRLSGPSR